jgi:integrase/recombinase XerD
MTRPQPNVLGAAVQHFFAEHLPSVRGLSPHTIRSYRDTFSLLLRFVIGQRQRPLATLDIDDFDSELILAFLDHLEDSRGNQSATRNVRLAALHAFFRYLAGRIPERFEQSQRILAIPFKRTHSRPVEYFEREEIQAVLAAVDRSTSEGRRNYALIATMFNTGGRVQEILDLRPCDLQLAPPFHARLFGKGRKERLCPLWPQTARLLRDLLTERALDLRSQEPLFLNHRGQHLSRYGARYILAKYCERARLSSPSLARKRLHPHSMRHSTAVHLLKAGVDLVTISHWLGHASVDTTNRYASVDLEAKREAISKIEPADRRVRRMSAWRKDPSILEWLEAL